MVCKTKLNFSHARIKDVINNILQDLDCTLCYRKTVTIANLCKKVFLEAKLIIFNNFLNNFFYYLVIF